MSALEKSEELVLEKNLSKELDHNGIPCIAVSKYWPDGGRLRRRFPYTMKGREQALKLKYRVETAINAGKVTWMALKKELTEFPAEKTAPDYTFRGFLPLYVAHVQKKLTTDYSARMATDVVRLIGDKKMKTFSKLDAEDFAETRLSEGVERSTVNKGLNSISAMFKYAIKYHQLVEDNPMQGFERLTYKPDLPDVLEPWEVRLIIEKTLEVDPVVGAYIGILAETGLRKSEGLHLKRHFFDVRRRQLILEPSKNFKPRPHPIPLSDYAMELVRDLPVVVDSPYLFIRMSRRDRMRWPNDAFNAGKLAAGILWPSFHDFRRYRATQWLRGGCSIDHVRDWLGHADIETTALYLKYKEGPAVTEFRRAEESELAQIRAGRVGEKQATTDIQVG